ncbi:MAG: arylsulfatase [Verrucomicrobia bacterium]|nr:MAG: arylsulfatase [Verrucomicrobiota bacterium]
MSLFPPAARLSLRRAAAAILLGACLTASLATARPPNILVIHTDDHRYSGIHALGGQPVHTPHLDRLVHDGFTFHRAYLMGSFSGATCIPSRNALLTGRHLFGMIQPGHRIPSDHITLGEAFRAAGYHAHIVGKWHQDTTSLARSFDSGATIMGLGAYLTDHYRMPLWDWDPTGRFPRDAAYLLEYDQAGNIRRRPLSADDPRGPIGTEATGPHSSEIFADSAIDFLRHPPDGKPWLMYLAFHAPHDPRQAPRRYREMYPDDQIPLPPSYLPQHPFDNGHIVLRDEQLAPWPRTPEIARQHLADYYAIITHLDAQIGRVIETLKTTGQWENTLVVVAGDSGLAVGNHGLLGKQNIYDEDGVHIPLIFTGGALGSRRGSSEAFCYNHDIFPTLCELAGIPIPASVQGLSLAGIIRGEQKAVRNHTYHAYLHYQRAYRSGDYKLIEYVRAPGDDRAVYGDAVRGSRVTQLFNFRKDPWETHDLSAFPEYAATIAAMRSEMRATAANLGDTGDRLNNYSFDFWDYVECPARPDTPQPSQ